MGCRLKAQASVEVIFSISFLLLIFGILMIDYNTRSRAFNNEEIKAYEKDLCNQLSQRITNILVNENSQTSMIIPEKIRSVNYSIKINGPNRVIILNDEKGNNIFCQLITTEVYNSSNNNDFFITKTSINITNNDSKVVLLW